MQARLDAQRSALVAAAADILAEDGYAGCSITAVAGRAGVASGPPPPGAARKIQAAACLRLAKRLRATSAAAAAPNSSTIGGAGTGCGGPPDEPG